MRLLAFLSLLLSAALLYAHEVSGTVEILLKKDKKKSDLSSVVVYLEARGARVEIPRELFEAKYVISTRKKQFEPRALAVPVGAEVDFPNYDSIFHNIFSVSKPNNFDLGLYKGGTSKSKAFSNPGVVKVFCNVHPHMTATIVVSGSPYFTVSDSSGKFSLGTVPSGVYTLHAYAVEGTLEKQIEVGATPMKLEVIIDGRNYKSVRHKNKYGKDYSTNENDY